jgi:hypothetical protein
MGALSSRKEDAPTFSSRAVRAAEFVLRSSEERWIYGKEIECG